MIKLRNEKHAQVFPRMLYIKKREIHLVVREIRVLTT